MQGFGDDGLADARVPAYPYSEALPAWNCQTGSALDSPNRCDNRSIRERLFASEARSG